MHTCMCDLHLACMVCSGHFYCRMPVTPFQLERSQLRLKSCVQDKAEDAKKGGKSYFESAKDQASKLLGQAGDKADDAKGEAKAHADEAHKESKGEPSHVQAQWPYSPRYVQVLHAKSMSV